MKIIEILADSSYLPALKNIAEKQEAADYWAGPAGIARSSIRSWCAFWLT